MLPFFCAVPTDTPVDPQGVRTVPSAGPYYVESYVPGQSIVLRRNPNYEGDRPHHLAEIRVAIGVPQEESLAQLEANRVDYALDGVPPVEDARLRRLYGRTRYFVNPSLGLYFLALNTSRAPFSDPALRRAANYAVDRAGLVRIAAPVLPAIPTDQYLPPGMPGFRDVHVYPSAPQPARARRLAGRRRVTAVFYTCTFCFAITEIVARNLAAIGVDVRVKTFTLDEVRARLGRRGEPFDVAFTGWSADFEDPSAFLDPLFDGTTLRATGNNNIAYLDDPAVNAGLRAAAALSGPARYLAYGELDARLVRDVAPLVALANPTRQDLFSDRIGCQVYNPIYGMDLAALCLRA
jgi:peptide/nickel transport system substrate-binding protein